MAPAAISTETLVDFIFGACITIHNRRLTPYERQHLSHSLALLECEVALRRAVAAHA